MPKHKVMAHALSLALVAAVFGSGTGQAQTPGTPPPAPEPRAVSARVERALEIAGPDAASFGLDVLCYPPSVLFQRMFALRDAPTGYTIRTGKAFDNIYHVGFDWVGAWLIATDEGLILVDALNNAGEAENLLVPAIREAGFDPADLRYVIVTHGHGDHFGGARYLQQTYGAQVVLSEADWELIENRSAEAAARVPGPTRDIVAVDGTTVTLGDTSVRILLTPGHSPGTISLVVPGRWRGETHLLTLAGGSAMPNSVAGTAQYLESFHKLWDAGRAAGAVGVLSTHAFMHGAIEKLETMRLAAPGGANPFILGEAGYHRFMEAQSECVTANLIRLALAAG